jgi:hypothetical protein
MTHATDEVATTTRAAALPHTRSMRVRIWAFFGGALLIFQLYVWFQWITGPYFVRVPTGVSDPPMYMKVFLTLNAAVLAIGLPFAIWHFWIKPWRRERRITLDGMLMASTGLMVFQDPLLNYFNTWCTYNTWLWNRGAWTSHVPGWFSPEEPGRMVAEPIINNFIGYSYGVLLTVILGCWVMGKIKSRWPQINNLQLIGLTFIWAIMFDFVMEALILLPMGFYTYPGAIQALSINAGTYYQYPIYEGFMWGGVETALCCLRYFTDSGGRTIVERGLDHVGGGFIRQQTTRFLAIFAAVSASFFFIYMVPAQWLAMHADPWPEDIQKRSYFIGGICGEGTDRLCPHPVMPVPSKHSGYVDKDGRFILPEGAELPKIVPFERSDD